MKGQLWLGCERAIWMWRWFDELLEDWEMEKIDPKQRKLKSQERKRSVMKNGIRKWNKTPLLHTENTLLIWERASRADCRGACPKSQLLWGWGRRVRTLRLVGPLRETLFQKLNKITTHMLRTRRPHSEVACQILIIFKNKGEIASHSTDKNKQVYQADSLFSATQGSEESGAWITDGK